MRGLDEVQKVEYAQCLIEFAKAQNFTHKQQWITALNNKDKGTVKRLKTILEYLENHSAKKRYTMRGVVLMLALAVSIFVLPNFVIFEPYGMPETYREELEREGAFTLDENSVYLLMKDDGTYDLYVNGQYSATVTEVFDESLKIYKEGDDAAQITAEDEESAKEAAIEYYSHTVFSERIITITRVNELEKYEAYILDERVMESTLAFEVKITESEQMRVIILTKTQDGPWLVINEGF
jgi:hypothetical protein